MSLLTASIVKNSHILDRIYFVFPKICRRPNVKGFHYQIWTSVNYRQSSYQVKHISTIFSKLVTLVIDWNSVKGTRVTKIDKHIKFEGVYQEIASGDNYL